MFTLSGGEGAMQFDQRADLWPKIKQYLERNCHREIIRLQMRFPDLHLLQNQTGVELNVCGPSSVVSVLFSSDSQVQSVSHV